MELCLLNFEEKTIFMKNLKKEDDETKWKMLPSFEAIFNLVI